MLTDHQVRGRVVVPVVIVLDAMLRAARGLVGDAMPGRCVTSRYSRGSPSRHPSSRASSYSRSSQWRVVRRDGSLTARAACVIGRCSDTESNASPTVSVPQMSGSAWPISVEDAYAVHCFTGRGSPPSSISMHSGLPAATGRLKGLDELGWPHSDWAIDPAAMDGGLQLGMLWASAHGHDPDAAATNRACCAQRPHFPETATCVAVSPRTRSATNVSTSMSRIETIGRRAGRSA